MEGHISLTITKLQLSAISLSAKALTKNDTQGTDLVVTKEEDAIPGSINSYNDRDKMLNLSTDKEISAFQESFPFRPDTRTRSFLRNRKNRTPSGMKPATASR